MNAREAKLQAAERVSGHSFGNPHLLWEALQIAGGSVNVINGRNIPEGNKSLAGVGDAVITLVLRAECHDEEKLTGAAGPYLLLLKSRPSS